MGESDQNRESASFSLNNCSTVYAKNKQSSLNKLLQHTQQFCNKGKKWTPSALNIKKSCLTNAALCHSATKICLHTWATASYWKSEEAKEHSDYNDNKAIHTCFHLLLTVFFSFWSVISYGEGQEILMQKEH